MKLRLSLVLALTIAIGPAIGRAQNTSIRIQADQDIHRVSRCLTGACIEDVNHEIYGGLYSQMIFGESFQEPAPPIPIRGFKSFGGSWYTDEGELLGNGINNWNDNVSSLFDKLFYLSDVDLTRPTRCVRGSR